MLRFFAKRQIFVLTFVLIAGCLAVFLWIFFAKPPEKILSHLKFFQAALVSQPVSESGIQNLDFSDEEMPQDFQSEELAENPAVYNEVIQEDEPTHEPLQEQLDDIAEKLDIISRQITDLSAGNLEADIDSKTLDQEQEQDKDEPEAEAESEPEKEVQTEQPIVKSEPKIVVSGGKPNYPKVLISEVHAASRDDEKQEFVELYNPNNGDIGLTGWYLQKKTAGSSDWSTFASKNLFNGKTISGNGYFLISRTGYYSGLANVFTDISITDDNSFALKNPNGDISDKLGFGNAQDPELLPAENPGSGQSIGRKTLDNGSERETDNNFFDFELQAPTPKMPNLTYVAPAESPAAALKNILINEIQIVPIGQRFIELYNPNSEGINLTGWYLQRKTKSADSWSSLVSSTNFEGKTIPANGYFLISREIENSDILLDITLSEDNSLLLKNPEGDISDKLGFGNAQDFEITPALSFLENQSLGRKFNEESQDYFDTDDNSVDFDVQAPTPKQENIVWVEPPPEPRDTTPPEIIFLLGAAQNEFSFTINFEITDPMDVVTPSGLASYIFRWREGEWPCQAEALCEGWQEDPIQEIVGAPSSHSAHREFAGESNKTYFFQISAKDLLGNESGWLPETPAFTTVSASDSSIIVINEVQIEGGTAKEDWIEFYNPNDFDILLSDYNGSYMRLVKRAKTSTSDATIKSWFGDPGAKIPAKGYYLWASSADDSYPSSIGADAYTKQNIADDNGVALRVGAENTGEIVDAVGWGLFDNVLFETLSAMNPGAGQSITRTAGIDTNNNNLDFMVSDAPSPGR